jgi:hypothetical protein
MSEATAKALTSAQGLVKKAASHLQDAMEKLTGLVELPGHQAQLETLKKDVDYVAERLGMEAAQQAQKPE